MNQKIISIQNEVILSLLKKEGHGREISRQLGIPLTSVQRALRSLEVNNIIEAKISGKNRVYALKRGIASAKHVYNAENYKFYKLIEKYPHLTPLFEDVQRICNSPLIVLFGSYASFSPTKESDIDLYVETRNLNVKKQIEDINSRLNVKVGDFNLKSSLIKEIVKNHVIIRGVEIFYEKTGFFS